MKNFKFITKIPTLKVWYLGQIFGRYFANSFYIQKLLNYFNFYSRCNLLRLLVVLLLFFPVIMKAQLTSGPCNPTLTNVLVLSDLFSSGRHTSSDLYDFRDGIFTGTNSTFILATSSPSWWNTTAITGNWIGYYNLFNGNPINNILTAQNYPSNIGSLNEIYIEGDFIVDEDLYKSIQRLKWDLMPR